MPTLDWIGKKAVVNHHRDVPYRLIHCDKDKSVGDPDAGNLLVQGDNLEALKALLPYYAGKVKCIYIDPPYNTGNEGWVYNDNVNSPEIKAWLGSVVGKEAEDLSRHDKWLCMMYPRLRLLKEFLSDDGSIWISIDGAESHNLRSVLDEIFGRYNFQAQITWQRKYSVSNNFQGIATVIDYILVYSRTDKFKTNLLPRSLDSKDRYSNPDNDPRGVWKAVDYLNQASPEKRPNLCYDIKNPNTGDIIKNTSKAWKYEYSVHEKHVEENRIWWGQRGINKSPALKLFLSEVRDGMTPSNLWLHDDSGHTDEAAKELINLFGVSVFDTPKPSRLIRKILHLATDRNAIVMDSFAGSGTTGQAVLEANADDGGNRKVLLVEMEPTICQPVTAARLERVISGYDREKPNGNKDRVEGTGSGFRFCTLGEPLFDADGNVSSAVTYPDLAAHVFFCETGSPIPRRAEAATALIGTFQGRAIYLLHNAEAVGVASTNAGNVLTGGILDALPLPEPGFTGARIVYGEGCTVPDERLSRLGVTFKQIPYQIEGL
jgi:adenine-specific DNA-methyltransferase